MGASESDWRACQKDFITQVTNLDTVSINDFRRVENPHASQLRCVGTLAFCFHPVRYFKT